MLNRLSHPKAFYLLSLTEIWERFGFYATRGLLVLYLTKELSFTNQDAYALFAAFAALLYLTPLMGGYLSDRLLGTKYAVILGGIISVLGYVCLAFSGKAFLYTGLALIISGNGFFLPNIANAIGHLYDAKDTRRESAFSLFYAAINFGALIPPLFVGQVVSDFNWHFAFIFSAVSMLIGTVFFYFSVPDLKNLIEPPHPFVYFKKKILFCLLGAGLIISLSIFIGLLNYPEIVNGVLFVISAGFITYILKKSFHYSPAERNRVLICFLLTMFSVLFWVLSEQAAMSLTIFTEYNVQRHVMNWTIPTVMFQALNPLTIIILGPLFAKMWMLLEKNNLNPSIPTKFAFGTVFMGLGFIILPLAISFGDNGEINFSWLIASYILQSIGELLLSPVGLSMITELSPRSIIGLMMGMWYFATAVANSLAGIAASYTTLPSSNNNPLLTAPVFGHVFSVLGVIAIVAGAMVLFFVPMLKRGWVWVTE